MRTLSELIEIVAILTGLAFAASIFISFFMLISTTNQCEKKVYYLPATFLVCNLLEPK